MTISIIIPTYNRKELLRYTLDSVRKHEQQGVDMEVIVVDDGSVDGTEELVTVSYPEVVYLKNKGKGASAARNTGLELARGKYVQYLDSDDLVSRDFFSAKIQYLESHEDVNACYGAYEYFSSDGAFSQQAIIFKHKYPMIADAGNDRQHLLNYLSGNYIPQNAIIWRRNFLKNIGGHDVSLAINQDVELVIRAIFNKLNLAAVKDNTNALVRNHELDVRIGNANNESRKWGQVLELRKKIFGELEKYGYTDAEPKKELSVYIFDIWRSLRHRNADLAAEYLEFAKKVYWPVKIKGDIIFRTLGAMLGPVSAVKMKYFLLKRD